MYIILKTIIIYFIVFLFYNYINKKDITKLNVTDIIILIFIIEFGILFIRESKPEFIFLIPIFILIIINMLLNYFKPTKEKIIINNGKLNFNVVSKLKYSLDDLLNNLRKHNMNNIEEVNYAAIDKNGQLIFKEKEPLPLIVDGHIRKDSLLKLGKNINWLDKELKNRNINLNEVFYAFYIKDKTFIITKNY